MIKTIIVPLSIFFFLGCTNPHGSEVISMGFTPAENAESVTSNGKILADLVEKSTGVKIKTYVASDYTALVEAMRGGQAPFAWLASFGYVLAEKHAGAKILLKAERFGHAYFYSAIIVRADSPFKTIKDLREKTIAWVDPASASGFIVPKSSLLGDGIDVDHFFKRQVFAGGHDTALLSVLNKTVDAAATFTNEPEGKTGAWNMLNNSKPEYAKKIRVIYVSKPIPNETFATTEKFYSEHRDIVEKVKNAIVHLSDSEEGKKALHDLYRIDKMVPATSSEYDPLKKAADVLHLGLESK